MRRWGLFWIKIPNLSFIALGNVGLPISLSDWPSFQQIFIWRLIVLWQRFFGLSHPPFRVEDIRLHLILASTSQCFGNRNIYCKWVRPRPHSSNVQLLYHCNSTGSNSFLWAVQFHFSRVLVPFLQILRKNNIKYSQRKIKIKIKFSLPFLLHSACMSSWRLMTSVSGDS